MKAFTDPEVTAVFEAYPPHIRQRLIYLRQLIFATAADIPVVGELEEALRWGEPSYLTASKSGSTIRLNWKVSRPDQYFLHVICRTSLIETFSKIYKDTFLYEDNRSIVFNRDDQIDEPALKHCIALALTYHRRKTLWPLDR